MQPFRFAHLAGLGLLICSQSALADAIAERSDGATDTIQKALKAEAVGDVVARKEQLDEALRADPSSKEANWQSGRIERDGRWVQFDAIRDQATDDATLAEYRERRDKTPILSKDQLQLADWCRAHKLFDRERAHLIAALERSPNGSAPAICTRLGLRQIAGVWISEDEIRAEKLNQVATHRNLKKWQPIVQRLANKLDHQNPEARAQARADLAALDNPEVLPGLEAVLAEAGMEKARLLVELLGNFETVKAAEPLTRLAVLSEWNVVREEAAEKLRDRPVGSYAPELLASLRTPIDANINLFVGADGVHVTQQLSSETQSVNQHFERVSSHFVKALPATRTSFTAREENRDRRGRAFGAAELKGSQEVHAAEVEVAKRNDDIENWNDRVCHVLASATGLNLPAEPAPWWEWWRDYNHLSQTTKRQEYETSYSADTTTYVETLPQVECLVAGTPVCTDRGMVPIETIKVGDLVLSKNPESGELTFKPVTRATDRDPEPIFKVKTDQGEIRGTGGHMFWISGRGWTRLRDVKADARFHGATSPAVVREIAADGSEKTYNLVVADFHTYFVGADMVLSHDVTYAKPIDAQVPGMKVAANQ